MTQAVSWRNEGGVAVVTIDNPPVNALGQAVRAGLVAAIEAAEADPDVRAVVIRAEGKTFPVGADIREFGKPPQGPALPDVCARIEACPKPVIAALKGTVLGGGLEVALGAHVRIAQAGTTVGFPEVLLGIPPGAGGTQRMPRLTGAQAALDMMLSGKPQAASLALERGLLDGVVEEDLDQSAIALAQELAAEGKPPRQTRDRRDGFADPVAFEAAIAKARKTQADPNIPAPGRIVDCVEASLLLPFEAGMAYERAAFMDCLDSAAGKGLRHMFAAERAAAHIPETGATPRAFGHVGVIGGGLMGAGIATAALAAGLRVTMIERDHDSLVAGLDRVSTIHDRAVEKGRMRPEDRDEQWTRIKGSADMKFLAEADLIIEAATEDEALKTAIFRQIDAIAKPGAILATNTSYLDINILARATSRPADVIGLHFFSPAQVMRLLEVVVGSETAPEVVATGFALARRLGKIAVRAGVCDGFIGNRIFTAYRTAADFLLEDGASPAQIDAAMRDFGMPLGPFQVGDMAGLDISWARRKRLAATRDPDARYVRIGDLLCEAGRFGQKTGRGYYIYPEGSREGVEDPEVLELAASERARKGLHAHTFTKAEIQRRCLAAMVNEGARILEEGIAQRPSDIDVVLVFGYGYPRWRGGPMKTADLEGLPELRRDLLAYAHEVPVFWEPAPLLHELIKNGRSFDDMNKG